MKEMKTLTLGNQTYEVVDGKAARSNAIVALSTQSDWEEKQLEWKRCLDGTFTLTQTIWDAEIIDYDSETPEFNANSNAIASAEIRLPFDVLGEYECSVSCHQEEGEDYVGLWAYLDFYYFDMPSLMVCATKETYEYMRANNIHSMEVYNITANITGRWRED